jgi:hypothetical protein
MSKKDPVEQAQERKDTMTAKFREEQEKADPDWKQFTTAIVSNVGRPSLYEDRYCTEVVSYFASKPPYRALITMFGPKMIPNDLPTLAGIAVSIGVCKKTTSNWCDEHPEFLRAVELAKAIQEHIWATNTLHKLYDKTFSIFFGNNNLGYVEKIIQEVDDNRSDPVEDLARKLIARSHVKFTLQSKNDLYTCFEQAIIRDAGDRMRFSYPADHPLTAGVRGPDDPPCARIQGRR